ncbi:glycosyltransferase family 8 protein [Pectobacterium sp. B1J-3]|uniref:glycosyltransferase family 8 protein n=1 Tax=Pectobacterium sp. B1J-3 TaxID=3385371 RepID=UPI003905FDE2
MNKTTSINIAYCADSNYIEYVAVSMTSVMMNNLGNDITFHIFLYNVNSDDKDRIKNIGYQIEIYEISENEIEKYSEEFSIKHLNRSIYLRLAVPRILYNKVDRFIYLDVDTLCFSNISEINTINIDHVVCAVVSDNTEKINTANATRLGLKDNFYFNSGFLYINTENWITRNIENEVNDILKKDNIALIYPDQDALNIVLQNDIVVLNTKWNYLFNWLSEKEKDSFFYDKENLPKIIHFTGGRKPWYQEHSGLSQNLYLFYKHFTPWANTPLKSYQSKMRSTDYRVYSKSEIRKGNYLKGLYFFIKYFQLKIKSRKGA